MGFDPFSPISLAQVNVLCVPVGQITALKFEEYIRALRAFSVVALRNAQVVSRFYSYKEGHVLLNVGDDGYRAGINKSVALDLNAKPQVLIGLVDGEQLTSDHEEDSLQWLEASLSTLQGKVTDSDAAVVPNLIVLGGVQIPTLDNIYFVDLDGDGPSLFDVLQQLVANLQGSLEAVAADLLKQISSVTAENAVQPSSGNNSNRASTAVRISTGGVGSSAATSALTDTTGNERNDSLAKATILLGQLNLQTGQWPDAMRHFTDGFIISRDNVNHLWHARALEGLLVCMMLCVWAGVDFNIPKFCYPANDKKGLSHNSASVDAICIANRSALDIVSNGRSDNLGQSLTMLTPHLLDMIVSIQERATGIFQDEEHFRLLCQSRVRWGCLLLVVKRCGGLLNPATVQHIINADNSSLPTKLETSSAPLSLPVKALSKLFVDAALDAKARLPLPQSAPIQVAVATNFALLGVERKQAFHLREFLQSLGPALIEARRIGAAEVGVHPSASLPPLLSLGRTSGGVPQPGIISLLAAVCEAYGLSNVTGRPTGQQISPKDQLQDALVVWSSARQAGDVSIKLDLLGLCIEVSDAVPDPQCSLELMSKLLQVSLGKVTLYPGTSNPAPLITSGDQSRLILNIQRAVGACARYGLPDARARYWDKCLVRFIGLSGGSSSTKLIPRTARDLSLATNAKSELGKDPFIYNPFSRAAPGAGDSVIAVGEQITFDVILQNPLQVDVEIEDIMLKAEGCDFEPDHHSIVLGPLCSQVFTLTGKALQVGNLFITGCIATVRGCCKEEFVIVHGDWMPSHTTKSMIVPSSTATLRSIQMPEISRVSLKVTTALPKLAIASTSLLQQSVMLLEGEKTTFKLTLQNDSEIDVDFVLFTFEDPVSYRLQEALNNKDLLPADLYEIQNQIASRPVVKLIGREKNDTPRVARRAQANFTFELFGRPGLTDVNVMIDYAYLGKPKEEIQELFYTRQLRHTILTTINGSIDIPRCAVLPLQNNLLATYTRLHDPVHNSTQVENLKSKGNETKYCILLLDVRNIWPQPLEVEFHSIRAPEDEERNEKLEYEFSVSETLQPGQMTRMLLLVPRILIIDPYAPIPSLDTKRQFVVRASRMTIEAEAASRETFWYREYLLKYLRGAWREQKGSRKGPVDLRKGIRLSSRMIDALKVDLVEITFSVTELESTSSYQAADSSAVTQLDDSHFCLQRNSFATLVVKVHNRSSEALGVLVRIQPSLRHQPHNIALDLSKRFAWTGALQKALHPPLKPDESREIKLDIIALSEGEYDINGTAEEIRSRSCQQETAILGLAAGAERRIWHARNACLIDAIAVSP